MFVLDGAVRVALAVELRRMEGCQDGEPDRISLSEVAALIADVG